MSLVSIDETDSSTESAVDISAASTAASNTTISHLCRTDFSITIRQTSLNTRSDSALVSEASDGSVEAAAVTPTSTAISEAVSGRNAIVATPLRSTRWLRAA